MKNIVILLLLLACFACDNDDPTANPPATGVTLDLVILDEQDQVSDIFPPGTDIRVVLRMINNTGHEVEWREGFTCGVLNSDGFMDVFKRNDAGSSPPAYALVGTPYQRPIDCEGVFIPPMIYPPGESVILAIPWSLNPVNEPLTDGEYFVSGTLELLIEGQNHRWELKKEFVIE